MMRAGSESVKRRGAGRRPGANYPCLVVVFNGGLCLAVAVEWRAGRRFVVAFPAAFPAADASSALDDTRVECFARCLTTFLGAASAIESRVDTATTATSSIFIVLRIMESPSSPEFPRKPHPRRA